MKLKLLEEKDFEELFKFEKENKIFFEERLSPREKGYFEREEFDKIQKKHLQDMEKEGYRLYLLYEGKELKGRFNINRIEENYVEIGYRVGEKYCGRGVGGKGLKLLIEEIKSLPYVDKIRAFVEKDNIASVRMLEKEAFVLKEDEPERIEEAGKTLILDVYYFYI